ncbi:MAG: M16 family metallopeptidase [Bacteroidia bacterium]
MKRTFALAWVLLLIFSFQSACKSSRNSTADSATPSQTSVASSSSTTTSTTTTTKDPLAAKVIPFDPNTRTGVLENGFTYYIRQNAKPENYAEFRLAVNVGSLHESDTQQGLAHFVEHMCFNGTKNFPKSALVDYLESIGTKFGAHLNAYTSFDETVYMLRVPTDDADKFSQGFQIMEDWAHNVTFEDEEIEKERGVVIEEWRTRLGAGNRMMQETLPKTFYQSRYAERLPIGKKDILETFPGDELRTFYKDWYRPDLMALVVVGDFADMDAVEARVKEMFGRIEATDSPKERTSYPIPDHKETLIAIAADNESPYNQISVLYKHPLTNFKTIADYRKKLTYNLASTLIDGRLEELLQSEKPPFSFAGSGYRSMARTKDAFNNFAVVQQGAFLSGLEALLTENERALRYGFTASELERAKKSYVSRLEKQVREKDKTESRRMVMSYVNHYLEGSPVPGFENSLALTQELFPSITLADVNEAFKSFISDESRVITLTGTQSDDMPTEAEVRALLGKISGKELTVYQDNVSDEPLMAVSNAPGSVIKTETKEEIGVTELTLSNGVKVILKPTDYQNDQILMRAYSPGGSSLVDNDDYLSATYGIQAIMESGLANYDNIQLDKYLSDKQLRVGTFVGELYEGMSGSTSPKDLETFLQLAHLYFTAPRKDEKAFKSSLSKTEGFFANLMSSPENYFRSEVVKVMGNGHPRAFYLPSPEQWAKIDMDRAFEIYQQRFANAADFTFLFVGNFDVDAIQPMLNKYLGSLPALAETEEWKDLGMTLPEGPIDHKVYRGREPKSMVEMKFYGDFEWTGENRYNMQSAVQVLGIMLRESMREDKGGVYGVRTSASPSKEPNPEYAITISFVCSPDNVDDLVNTAWNDIKTLQEEGASEKNLQKVQETQRKEIESGMQQNNFWMGQLYNAYRNGIDPTLILKQMEKIDGLNGEAIQQAAKTYFKQGNYAQFVMYPEQEEEPKP